MLRPWVVPRCFLLDVEGGRQAGSMQVGRGALAWSERRHTRPTLTTTSSLLFLLLLAFLKLPSSRSTTWRGMHTPPW